MCVYFIMNTYTHTNIIRVTQGQVLDRRTLGLTATPFNNAHKNLGAQQQKRLFKPSSALFQKHSSRTQKINRYGEKRNYVGEKKNK